MAQGLWNRPAVSAAARLCRHPSPTTNLPEHLPDQLSSPAGMLLSRHGVVLVSRLHEHLRKLTQKDVLKLYPLTSLLFHAFYTSPHDPPSCAPKSQKSFM